MTSSNMTWDQRTPFFKSQWCQRLEKKNIVWINQHKYDSYRTEENKQAIEYKKGLWFFCACSFTRHGFFFQINYNRCKLEFWPFLLLVSNLIHLLVQIFVKQGETLLKKWNIKHRSLNYLLHDIISLCELLKTQNSKCGSYF